MMPSYTKKYKSHRINDRNDLYNQVIQHKLSGDRYYMVEMMKPNFDYLEKHGIKEYQNFIESFKKIGCKTDDIRDFINEFKIIINSKYKSHNWQPLDWIKTRELNKANFGEKNIIINRLVLEYPNEFMMYSKNYIKKKIVSSNVQSAFIQELDLKINQLQDSSKFHKIFK